MALYYNLYLDGLRIYTTIDSRMQAYAENAVAAHMPNLQGEFLDKIFYQYNEIAPF